jgi:osmotically-inducible protein OsmY
MTTTTLTNREIQQAVEDELLWDPSVTPASIGVAVSDGAVTLTGTVTTLSSRLAAVKAAKRVKGVRAIADDIVVQTNETWDVTDQDVARFVEHALERNAVVPDTVRATVRYGSVTLDGKVTWDFQRRAATRAVEHLEGVTRVVNNIELDQTPTPKDLKRRITAALHRSADLDARSIVVELKDGEVWLSGTVMSWADREQAEAAAWAAPGVTVVHDDICIG